MQTPKPRSGSLELPHKKSSLPTTKTARRVKPESDPRTKTSSQKVATADRRSPRIPLNEKKRTGRIPELESQVTQLQEELKKAKEELNRSEALKREAKQEAVEAKKQLMEINTSEDSRIEELRKLSQERDRTWQSEVDAMKRQHGMDSAALSAAITEVQKLKSKLFETESELENSKFEVRSLEKLVRDSSSSSGEVETLKEAMNLAKQEISQLKSAVEVAERRYQDEYIQSTLQIRNAYEQAEAVKSKYSQREAELAEELKRTKAEVAEDFKKLESDLMKVRGCLVDKEMELQSLRSEMEKRVETVNTEAMEAELRRVKVQCEQWRKAAETAASILNNEEERMDSIENGKMLKKFGVLLKKNHK
ncbi:hypothetical protein N665_0436s0031 [Sinapis alba]|nr:hypothetical protein N665_0436s0031 [Sinapis alba]